MKYLFLTSKKYSRIVIVLCVLGIVLIFGSLLIKSEYTLASPIDENEVTVILQDYFAQRGAALVTGDPSFIKQQFDSSSTYGKWSYEHEIKRINYLRQWSEMMGITFKECTPKLKIFTIKPSNDSIRVYVSVLTKLTYTYKDKDISTINEFSLGTKHTIKLVNKQGAWYVTVDWYSDPLEDTIPEPAFIPTNHIMDEVMVNAKVKYNRSKAIEYADKYSGANWYLDDGYKYNKKYRNYADLGGDCANFASQILSDKDGGGMKMGGGWLYNRGSGSSAWVNAGSFTKYLLYSGKAKQISRGNYSKVSKFTNQLSPGDIIAYEKKGDIVHVSIVTAKDSQGVLLVNSHTNDRYHVPWDLGWSSRNITFWLLRIND